MDGEILETLWAPFNKISPSARSMTSAHHQELYDDHMRDSNWKKLVGLGGSLSHSPQGFKGHKLTVNVLVKSLLRRHKAALEGVQTTKGPYEEFSSSLDPSKLKAWVKMAETADYERGKPWIYILCRWTKV